MKIQLEKAHLKTEISINEEQFEQSKIEYKNKIEIEIQKERKQQLKIHSIEYAIQMKSHNKIQMKSHNKNIIDLAKKIYDYIIL
jgi:hypothetical protein